MRRGGRARQAQERLWGRGHGEPRAAVVSLQVPRELHGWRHQCPTAAPGLGLPADWALVEVLGGCAWRRHQKVWPASPHPRLGGWLASCSHLRPPCLQRSVWEMGRLQAVCILAGLCACGQPEASPDPLLQAPDPRVSSSPFRSVMFTTGKATRLQAVGPDPLLTICCVPGSRWQALASFALLPEHSLCVGPTLA